MSILLKKGETVFLSESGNRGFYYPTDKCDTLLTDVNAKTLAWSGSQDKKAVLIPISSIRATYKSEGFVPVWIKKSG
tara:strand:+ start:1290 stop:1520 length:231 start_codon:yes stop_codon:yes gene_type:complete